MRGRIERLERLESSVRLMIVEKQGDIYLDLKNGNTYTKAQLDDLVRLNTTKDEAMLIEQTKVIEKYLKE